MKTKYFIIIFLILFSYIYPYKYEKQVRKSFVLEKDGRIILTNVNGIIKLSTNKKNKVIIEAVKLANKKEDLDNVKIEFEYQKNLLNISTKKIKKKYKVIINFYISVPENTSFIQLNSKNGRIEAKGNFKDLKSNSINGEIKFEGNVAGGDFTAINGSINLYIREELQGNMSAITENGSVKMELNEESSFRIDASSLNGYIKSDFDIPITKGFVTTKIKGNTNNGRYKIFIKTTNGSIKLLKI